MSIWMLFVAVYCIIQKKNDAKVATGKQTMLGERPWALRFDGCWNAVKGTVGCYFSSSGPGLVRCVLGAENTSPSLLFERLLSDWHIRFEQVENSPGHAGCKSLGAAFSGGALESRMGSVCGEQHATVIHPDSSAIPNVLRKVKKLPHTWVTVTGGWQDPTQRIY